MTSTLLPWQERLVAEKVELDVKIQKLKEFLDSPKYKELASQDKLLLAEQHHYMLSYTLVLEARIARF